MKKKKETKGGKRPSSGRKKAKIMENIKFYIDFFGGGDAEKACLELKVCAAGKKLWLEWVSGGNDPFAFVPPDGWDWLKKAAAEHSNATLEILAKCAGEEYWEVRCAAVEHPNATTEMLLKGVMDEHWVVRKAAVLHLNATAEILEKVAEDEDWVVREAAARNPNYGKFLNN
jgi:hypothetical protein